MLDLILDTDHNDDRIRAVSLGGSRANPNAPRDIFQDFDILFLVNDVLPFKKNYEWIKRFGEIMIIQEPEDMQDPPPRQDGGYVYLMQFTDGNRIDLGIYPLDKFRDICLESLSVVLLDKDGFLEDIPPASERDYFPKPPTDKEFSDCCNEFWWVCLYVAKGLWRGEIIYAKYISEHYVREQLMKMLTWYIGVNTRFSENPGKFGKYFQNYLPPEWWELLLRTYTTVDVESTWEALFVMCDLFRKAAQVLAEYNGFDYPHDEDRRVTSHLEHPRTLPYKATEMY